MITAAFLNPQTHEETYHIDFEGHKLLTRWIPKWGYQTEYLSESANQLEPKQIHELHQKLEELKKTLDKNDWREHDTKT